MTKGNFKQLPLDLLHRKAEDLREQLRVVEATIQTTQSRDDATSPARRQRHSRSVRDLVLDALFDLGFITYSQQLSLFVEAKYGRAIPAARFGSLSLDEKTSFQKPRRRTVVWLCHGLAHDTGEPVKRLWGRSDWDLPERVVTPLTGRIQYLKMTARLTELAMEADDSAAQPDRLRFLAADHARGIGQRVRNGDFTDLPRWRELAVAQLRDLEARDRQHRDEAARRLSERLSATDLLFGATVASAVQLVAAKPERNKA